MRQEKIVALQKFLYLMVLNLKTLRAWLDPRLRRKFRWTLGKIGKKMQTAGGAKSNMEGGKHLISLSPVSGLLIARTIWIPRITLDLDSILA